jgi:hypothetical protein
LLVSGLQSRGNIDRATIGSVIEETAAAEIADNRWPGMDADAGNPQ